MADRRGNDGDGLVKNRPLRQFSGYFTLEDIDLANYAGVPCQWTSCSGGGTKSQVVKQADVVALLALLPEEFAPGTEEDNFRYYEPRCGHGSSLSPAMHGVVAARLGGVEMALRYFRQAAAIDLADTHAAIDGGVHIAGLGGIWMLAIFGFAGLSLQNDGVAVDPHLPAAWRSLTFRVQWRHRCLRIRIYQQEQLLEATLESGEPITLVVRGERYELRQNLALRVFTGGDNPRSFSAA